MFCFSFQQKSIMFWHQLTWQRSQVSIEKNLGDNFNWIIIVGSFISHQNTETCMCYIGCPRMIIDVNCHLHTCVWFRLGIEHIRAKRRIPSSTDMHPSKVKQCLPKPSQAFCSFLLMSFHAAALCGIWRSVVMFTLLPALGGYRLFWSKIGGVVAIVVFASRWNHFFERFLRSFVNRVEW